MIKTIKVTEGYASKLPLVKSKTFTFTPGVNLLYGMNGCGKSSIMKIIGAYCSIPNGGWSRLLRPRELGFCNDKPNLPERYFEIAPGKCKATVAWDGQPVFLQQAKAADQSNYGYFFDSVEDSDDGMTSMIEQVTRLTSKPSSGLTRQTGIMKMLDVMKSAPSWKDIKAETEIQKSQLAYIKSIGGFKAGIKTLLLDEPDASLDIQTQLIFWGAIIPKLARDGFQIIIASHNPLGLFLPLKEVNVIDFARGYSKDCLGLVTRWTERKLTNSELVAMVKKYEVE